MGEIVEEDDHHHHHQKEQISCVTGIFQLFHRHRILSFTAGIRRLCTNKRFTNSSNSTSATVPELDDDNCKQELNIDASCRCCTITTITSLNPSSSFYSESLKMSSVFNNNSSTSPTESSSHSLSSIQTPLHSSESLNHSLGWKTCLKPPQQTPNMEKPTSISEGEELAVPGSTLGLQPRCANPDYRKREADSVVLSDSKDNNIRLQFSSERKEDRRASSVDYKEMTRKNFDQKLKEAPRFSLDSKLNDKNGHRRSSSGNVVAKLMGLEEIIKPTSSINLEATAMPKLIQKTSMAQNSTNLVSANPNDRLGSQMHTVMSHNQEVGMDSSYKDLDSLLKQINLSNSISFQKLRDHDTQTRLIRPSKDIILPVTPVNHPSQFSARTTKEKIVISKEPARLRRVPKMADLSGTVNECSSIRTGKCRTASTIIMKTPGQKLHSLGAVKSHTHFAESNRLAETRKGSQALNHSPYSSATITRSLRSPSSTSESSSSRKWQSSSNIERELSNTTFAKRCLANDHCSQSRNRKGLKKSAVVMMKDKEETRGTNHSKRSPLNSQGTTVPNNDKGCLSKEHVKRGHNSVCSMQYTEGLLPRRDTEDATIEYRTTNILMDFPTCIAQINQSVAADEKTSDISTELKEQVENSDKKTCCTKDASIVDDDFQQKKSSQMETENVKHPSPISALEISFSSNENDQFPAASDHVHNSDAEIINPIDSNNILHVHQDCAYRKENRQLHSGNQESTQNIQNKELNFVGGINFITAPVGLSEVLNAWMNQILQVLYRKYNSCMAELHPPSPIFSDEELLENSLYGSSGSAAYDNWHWPLLYDTVNEILRKRLQHHNVRQLHELFSFNSRIGINIEGSSLIQESLLKEVLGELESVQYYCIGPEEEELINDTTNQLGLIQKDIAHPQNQWSDYDEEWVEASLELEGLIMDDLIQGNIQDLIIQWSPHI